MRESTQIALTYVQSKSEMFGLPDDFFNKKNVHVHFPDGSTPKTGPSAGLIIATAITSAVTEIEYNRDVAGTGEIDLRGNALPIGGVREKMFAAYIAGSTKVFIPQENAKDLREVSQEVKDRVEIVPVSRIEEVLLLALDFDASDKAQRIKAGLESVLGIKQQVAAEQSVGAL
jgi:ATP-dependent Lon protease